MKFRIKKTTLNSGAEIFTPQIREYRSSLFLSLLFFPIAITFQVICTLFGDFEFSIILLFTNKIKIWHEIYQDKAINYIINDKLDYSSIFRAKNLIRIEKNKILHEIEIEKALQIKEQNNKIKSVYIITHE